MGLKIFGIGLAKMGSKKLFFAPHNPSRCATRLPTESNLLAHRGLMRKN